MGASVTLGFSVDEESDGISGVGELGIGVAVMY